MFDLIDGLPIHALVVHAVVVLLPLAVLGAIATAVRPHWRTRYGHLVIAAAAGATALSPVATASGEQLEKHVGDPGKHAALGDQLVWFAATLLIFEVALVWMTHRSSHSRNDADHHARSTERLSTKQSRAVTAVATVTVIAALAAGMQTYRVGESGARAAWGDQVTKEKPAHALGQPTAIWPAHGSSWWPA